MPYWHGRELHVHDPRMCRLLLTRQDKPRDTPVPASQAEEVSDLILIRPRLAPP